MHIKPTSLALLSLFLACACTAEPAKVPSDITQATEWAQLQKLLQVCTGVAKDPLPAAETCSLSGAPLLGNGEMGVMVENTANRMSLFIGRTDFRRYAIGGVDFEVEGEWANKPSSLHEQDIERAEIRSKVKLSGRDLTVTSWMATDQPLLICEVGNPSNQPLTLKVNTWTRPPMNIKAFPFRLKAGHLSTQNLSECLNDNHGKVVYGPPVQKNADSWRYVQVDKLWCLKNEATGRYMAITDDGNIITVAKPDKTADFRTGGLSRQGQQQWYANGYNLNASTKPDGSAEAIATRKPAPYGTSVEFAAHYFEPQAAGHIEDVCWAWRVYGGWGNDGGVAQAVILTRVINAKASIQNATQSVVLPAGGKVTLAIASQGDFNSRSRVKSVQTCRAEGKALLQGLDENKVAQLRSKQLNEWRDYWLKAYVDTGDSLLNKYWFGSMYLLKSTHHQGQQSAALFGVWNMSDNPICQNREFNNYNYQSQHYGTFTANRGELATAQFDDILKELPKAISRAARAGYEGAAWPRTIYHHFSGPAPTAFPRQKVANHKRRGALDNDQMDAPAFLAMNFMTAYETTLDRDFLEKKAYPMVLACADFYADYVVFNKVKNRYELRQAAAREGTNDINGTYPLAMLKRVVQAAADYSEVLGVDADKRVKWRDILAKLSDYPTTVVDGKPVFRECENSPRVALLGPGDNVSLLQVVHPTEQLNLNSDPKMLALARNTLAYMNSDPKKPSWLQKDNNLPQIFVDAACIGWDANDTDHWLHRYLEEEMRPNLTPQLWGVESPGGTEAIHRMMFQSRGLQPFHPVLRFFPAWPKNKDASFTRLRGFGAFLVSAQLKGGVVGAVQIKSEKGTPCAIVNPWPGKSVQVIRNGKKAEVVKGDRFTLKTAVGETLEIKAP